MSNKEIDNIEQLICINCENFARKNLYELWGKCKISGGMRAYYWPCGIYNQN